jgi:outer membrane protein TolC
VQVVTTTAMAGGLRMVGISANAAEAHATILAETVAMSYSGLATKDDIHRIEALLAQSQNNVILFVVGAALALGGLSINSIRPLPPRAPEPVMQDGRGLPPAPVPAPLAPAPPCRQK